MATLLVYLYAIALPLVGTIIACIAIFLARSDASSSSSPSPEDGRRLRARMIVFIEHSSTPFILSAVIAYLITRRAGSTPDFILESAAMAVGVPSFMASLGISIVYSKGVRALAKDPTVFGRVVSIGTLPVTAAVMGLALAFLIMGNTSLTNESAQVTALLMSAGGTGAILSAYLATSFDEEWCRAGFGRSIIRGTIGECVTLVLFVAAYLSLTT